MSAPRAATFTSGTSRPKRHVSRTTLSLLRSAGTKLPRERERETDASVRAVALDGIRRQPDRRQTSRVQQLGLVSPSPEPAHVSTARRRTDADTSTRTQRACAQLSRPLHPLHHALAGASLASVRIRIRRSRRCLRTATAETASDTVLHGRAQVPRLGESDTLERVRRLERRRVHYRRRVVGLLRTQREAFSSTRWLIKVPLVLNYRSASQELGTRVRTTSTFGTARRARSSRSLKVRKTRAKTWT